MCAKQVNCCGGLFCEACIGVWVNKETTGNRSCPICRAVMNTSNIVADLRSDRKSAAQTSHFHCPYHESHECDFIGTRQEVATHKLDCPCDPNLCTSQRCKASTAEWEAERTKWETEKAGLEAKCAEQAKNIQNLQQSLDDKSIVASATKAAFMSAALLSREGNLKRAYGFDGVNCHPRFLSTGTVIFSRFFVVNPRAKIKNTENWD